MSTCRVPRRVSIGFLLLVSAAAAAPQEKGAPLPASLQPVRERLRAQDFDGALGRLEALRGQGALPKEAVRLEALAHLGRAVREDSALPEGVARLTMAVRLRTAFERERADSPEEPFFTQTAGAVERFYRSAEPFAATAPARFVVMLESARKAHELAERNAREAPEVERARASSLVAWSRLAEYLVLSGAPQLLSRMSSCPALSLKDLARVERALAENPDPRAADETFRKALLPLFRQASTTKDAALTVAVGETLALYCASKGRVRWTSAGLVSAWREGPQTGLLPEQSGESPSVEVPSPRPVEVLTGPGVAAKLAEAPEDLLLPVFELAVTQDPGELHPAAYYGRHFALLRLKPEVAAGHVESWLRGHPSDAAFRMEQARCAAALRHDTPAALAALQKASARGAIRRPVFRSFPEELHATWFTSRNLTELAPRFATGYRGFFTSVYTPLGEQPQPGPADPVRVRQLTARLGVAQAIAGGSLLPDVVVGLDEARQASGALARCELTDLRRIAAVQREAEMDAALARLPLAPKMACLLADGVHFDVPGSNRRIIGPAMIVGEGGSVISLDLASRKAP